MTPADTDFPIVWDDPADAELTWLYDPEHLPGTITPLAFDLFTGPFAGGFGWFRPKQINYYIYYTSDFTAKDEFDALPVPERIAAGVRRWSDEILPEVVAQAAHYLSTDFDALSGQELAAEVERLRETMFANGGRHTQALSPYGMGMALLTTAYKELVADDELAALRLVQGYGNRSVDAGHALWRLSRLAASIPAVHGPLLAGGPVSGPALLAAFDGVAEARPFLDALAAYLDEFGWRSDSYRVNDPTWAEDPTTPLKQLRTYIEMPDYDPVAEQERLAAERDAAVRETLAALDAAGRERLQSAIDLARQALPLLENHNFYIDQRMSATPRRLVLAAARRLVAEGIAAAEDDIYYLTAGELRAALRGELTDVREVAAQRRDEMPRWAKVTPPRFVGKQPDGAPSGPMPGRPAAGREATDSELPGRGASAGVARGPARILLSLSDSDRLRPGDVLVASTTAPPWTPLFAIASAIVVETGGMLSHAAVVAREYGIPAVLGVDGARRLLRDGQLIEVDGTNGVVRIVG